MYVCVFMCVQCIRQHFSYGVVCSDAEAHGDSSSASSFFSEQQTWEDRLWKACCSLQAKPQSKVITSEYANNATVAARFLTSSSIISIITLYRSISDLDIS